MYTILLHAHSGWRWLVLLAGAAALVKAGVALAGKSSEWTKGDRIVTLLYPILLDVQALLGIALWGAGKWWQGQVPAISWEHPVTMLIALILAHVGLRRVKAGETCSCRHKHALAWYLVSMLTIVLGIVRVLSIKVV